LLKQKIGEPEKHCFGGKSPGLFTILPKEYCKDWKCSKMKMRILPKKKHKKRKNSSQKKKLLK
jgi:hypothetical protein